MDLHQSAGRIQVRGVKVPAQTGQIGPMDERLSRYRTAFMKRILRRLGRARFGSVIDFGCDDGTNLRRMASFVGAYEAMGVDFRAQDGEHDGITLRRGNVLEFVPDHSYELVISNQVFEHIYELWLPKYFATLRASCARGGIILLSTPNLWRSSNLVRLLTFGRPVIQNPNPGVPPEEHLGHHRECSYRELEAILHSEFPEPEFRVRIFRTFPRVESTVGHWLAVAMIYLTLWPLWRPLFVSASQDHYAVIDRVSARTAGTATGGERILRRR